MAIYAACAFSMQNSLYKPEIFSVAEGGWLADGRLSDYHDGNLTSRNLTAKDHQDGA
jgi:hypothetical protein